MTTHQNDTVANTMPPRLRTIWAELQGMQEEPTPNILPDRLALGDIKRIPELFQPRGGLTPHHVEELQKTLQDRDDLDPVLIFQIGQWPVLIDGHHRWEAYKRSEGRQNIPVSYLQGSLKDVLADANQENLKARLPLQPSERQNFAWRLVRIGLHSVKETAEAAGVSKAQVSIMRKALLKLGKQAASTDEWWRAKKAAQDMEGHKLEINDSWLDAQAQSYADRMYKEFGTKLTSNTDLAARALKIYFGERLAELMDELSGQIEGPEEDAFEDDF